MKVILSLFLLIIFFNTEITYATSSTLSSDDPTQLVHKVQDYLNKHGLYRNEENFKNYYNNYQKNITTFPSMTIAMMEIEIALKKAGGSHSRIINYKDNLMHDNLTIEYPMIDMYDHQIVHIKLPSVSNLSAHYYLQDTDAHQKISHYETAIHDFVKSHEIKGVILDLRENTGGRPELMISAINFLFDNGMLLKSVDANDKVIGEIILSNEGILKNDLYPIKQRLPHFEVPIAILTSGQTAGGSEVVTLALKHNPKYNTRIFGHETTGITTDMELVHLHKYTYMILSTGGFLTPDNTIFKNEKIIPDIITDEPEKEALEWLKEQQ